MRDKKYVFAVIMLLVVSINSLESSKTNDLTENRMKSELVSPSSAADHASIYIDGNAALDAFCAGNGTDGTEGNPHIIEGYTIDGGIGTAIEILNTDLYLIIQDCTIQGMTGTDSIGIHLYLSQNVTITSCAISTAGQYGIYLEDSDNNFLLDNSVFDTN